MVLIGLIEKQKLSGLWLKLKVAEIDNKRPTWRIHIVYFYKYLCTIRVRSKLCRGRWGDGRRRKVMVKDYVDKKSSFLYRKRSAVIFYFFAQYSDGDLSRRLGCCQVIGSRDDGRLPPVARKCSAPVALVQQELVKRNWFRYHRHCNKGTALILLLKMNWLDDEVAALSAETALVTPVARPSTRQPAPPNRKLRCWRKWVATCRNDVNAAGSGC